MLNWEAWIERCHNLLVSNQVTSGAFRYTRPAPHVYEYQWLWDSCFHAIVYRWFDVQMAQDELLSLVQHQVKSGDDAGMIPHMTYWPGDGAAMWGESHRSIITQPPLIAVAALRVYERSQDKSFLTKLFPHLKAYHDWFSRCRDTHGDGLVTIIHPWESGWDASPRWDAEMGLDHPTDEESKAARHAMVHKLREYACDARRFSAVPVDFNAIRAADLEATAAIAEIIGQDALSFRERAARVQKAMQTRKTDEIESAAQFVALFGGCATQEQAHVLVSMLESERYNPLYPVPTTPIDSPEFDGGHYWRGNVWLAVNWLIYTGLRRYGYTKQASYIAERSLALVEQSGFHEYFNPLDGEGLGPAHQSWSTIVLDLLATEEGR